MALGFTVALMFTGKDQTLWVGTSSDNKGVHNVSHSEQYCEMQLIKLEVTNVT